ncbi:hypothetical protein HPB51_001598 [Rhipicephalus microplus]|uniref:Uncharacterized protein n=1 Tax=Rhipicephalus microplus TaxID=6941 RepID=A0A9J6EQW2_RHIMP|nr:hypothetical protein HPB51_001598 [Rhipicephalus microplus]
MADEAIVRSHLLDFESGEHNWRGYVKTDQELEHLERALLGLGVSFKVTSSRKHAEENLHKAGKRPSVVAPASVPGCLLFRPAVPVRPPSQRLSAVGCHTQLAATPRTFPAANLSRPANFKHASCPPLLCSLPRYSWAVDLLPAVGSPWWWNFWWDVKCDHGRPMDSYLREDDITLLDFAPFASPLAAELTLPLGLGQPLSQAGLGL